VIQTKDFCVPVEYGALELKYEIESGEEQAHGEVTE
jgi:hypothetical protein